MRIIDIDRLRTKGWIYVVVECEHECTKRVFLNYGLFIEFLSEHIEEILKMVKDK